MSNQQMPGGWTKFRSDISSAELEIFKKALIGLTGVNYTPVAISSQVVNGTNYQFFCNGNVVIPNSANEAFMIEVYVDLNGTVERKAIMKIEHSLSPAT